MTAQTILPANTLSGGYDVANSLRFDVASDDHLDRSQSTGNQRTYTVSFWIKRGVTSGQEYIVSAYYGNSSRYQYIRWNGDNNSDKDCLDIFSGLYSTSSTSTSMAFKTNRKFRDVSAWYHIVLAVDTTQGTESNRVKIYVNGVQETSFATATYPSQNQQHFLNINGTANEIGAQNSSSTLGSYLSEVVLIDGSQLAADQFGEFDSDSGIWKPIDVSGLTFGTNGFYLEFKGSGTSANSSGLGADTSGNDHHFTVSNLTAVDQSTDTCTNNFAVLANHSSDDLTLTEGRLKFENPSGGHRMVSSTIAPLQGKWYAEVKMTTEAQQTRVGIIDPEKFLYNTYIHNAGRGYAYKGEDGTIRFNDGTTDDDYGDTYTTGDIVGIAMDLDNHKLYFSKNGTFQNSGDPTSGATGTGAAPAIATGVEYYIAASTQDGGTNPVIEFNFGNPSFAISSGNADANGHGNFEYAVPSGYYSLNTKNLAEFG